MYSNGRFYVLTTEFMFKHILTFSYSCTMHCVNLIKSGQDLVKNMSTSILEFTGTVKPFKCFHVLIIEFMSKYIVKFSCLYIV